MGGGFRPFRREVRWFDAREVRIRELLPRLEFASAAPNWGARLRFGLFDISQADMTTVLEAMGVDVSVSVEVTA